MDLVRSDRPLQPALEPVIHHLLDRVRGRRMQPTVKLSVGRLELVPDLGLGLTGDLAPDPLAAGPKPTEIAPTKRFFAASK
jgi:hypothetical protein